MSLDSQSQPGSRPLFQVTLAAVMLALFGVIAYWGWQRVRDQVRNDPAYLFDGARLQYTPQPAWVPGDVGAEVIRAGSLEGPYSLLDDRAAERVAAAFTLHPWISSARVTKSYPAGATVELTYRRPVLLVRRAAATGPPLFVLDDEGVRVPAADMALTLQQQLPRIVASELPPLLSQATQDSQLVGAVDVARDLVDVWVPLQFAEIVSSPQAGPDDRYVFELLTLQGDRVLWGTAPIRRDEPAELNGAERVARLRAYAHRHGSLRNERGSGRLDVLKLPPP